MQQCLARSDTSSTSPICAGPYNWSLIPSLIMHTTSTMPLSFPAQGQRTASTLSAPHQVSRHAVSSHTHQRTPIGSASKPGKADIHRQRAAAMIPGSGPRYAMHGQSIQRVSEAGQRGTALHIPLLPHCRHKRNPSVSQEVGLRTCLLYKRLDCEHPSAAHIDTAVLLPGRRTAVQACAARESSGMDERDMEGRHPKADSASAESPAGASQMRSGETPGTPLARRS